MRNSAPTFTSAFTSARPHPDQPARLVVGASLQLGSWSSKALAQNVCCRARSLSKMLTVLLLRSVVDILVSVSEFVTRLGLMASLWYQGEERLTRALLAFTTIHMLMLLALFFIAREAAYPAARRAQLVLLLSCAARGRANCSDLHDHLCSRHQRFI